MSNEELLERLREEIAKSEKHEHPCPNCGRCPTCGRGAAPSYPHYPYYPWYPTYCGITWGGNTVGISDGSVAYGPTTTNADVPVTLTTGN